VKGVKTGTPGWVACGLLLGVAACADVWGFKDLTLGDGGAQDATTLSDAPNSGSEGGEDAEVDSGQGADSGDGAADARAEGEGGEGGSAAHEGGAADAGDGGVTAADCMSICTSGCCNSSNICVTASATACGPPGQQCVDCPTASCTLGACCTSAGQCGCSLVLGCTKN
jgi:hypothetical protein